MKTVKKKNMVLSPTVDGTLEEVLASMVVVQSHAKPNNLTWDVAPETYFKVVIMDEEDRSIMQTSTTGSWGFYLGKVVNQADPYDHTKLVKGKQYFLYFKNQNVSVPFKITGKI